MFFSRSVSRRDVMTAALASATVGALGVAARSDAAEPSVSPQPGSSTTAKTTPHTTSPHGADGWLAVLAAHRRTVSWQVHDSTGTVWTHRAGQAQQSASSIKAFHLAAYADAVSRGRLDPKARVRVRDWERWYYPADGGAHAQALRRLGIAAEGTAAVAVAKDPSATVRLDDIVSAMIRESDNAAADFVRATVGAQALQRTVSRLGATATRTPSLLGMLLQATHPSLAASAPESLAQRYMTDERFAASLLAANSWSGYAQQAAFLAAHGVHTSARDLVRLYDAVATGSIAGADIMRRHLEWQPAQGGVATGFKAGSLPGVLSVGMEQRVPGTTRHATGALLIGGLDEATAGSSDFGWQELLVQAMSDPTYAQHVAATLKGTTPGSTPTGPVVQTDLVR